MTLARPRIRRRSWLPEADAIHGDLPVTADAAEGEVACRRSPPSLAVGREVQAPSSCCAPIVGPPASIASAIPVSWSVTEVLVITEELRGTGEDRSRAAARSSTTYHAEAVLVECGQTAAASVSSLRRVVKCGWVSVCMPPKGKAVGRLLPSAGGQPGAACAASARSLSARGCTS